MLLVLSFLFMDIAPVSYSLYVCREGENTYELLFDNNEVLFIQVLPGTENSDYNDLLLKSSYVLSDSLVVIKRYRLKVLDDKRLEVISLKGVQKGTILYCERRYYSNGKLKFTGGWKDGKQDGVWFYFDSKGKITQITYRSGKVIEQIENPTLEPLLKEVFSRTWRKRQIE